MASVQRATGKWAGVALACIVAFNLHAQTRDPVLDRISSAAKDTSQLADALFQLTDAAGPRVVGSPALRHAEEWLSARLRDYGLSNVKLERNPPVNVGGGLTLDPPAWSWSRLTVQQLAPWQQTLIAVPVMYSASTKGPVSGEVTIAPLPRPSAADITAFIERHRGRLRGRFLLVADREAAIAPQEGPGFHRYTPDELRAFAAATSPPPAAPPSPAPAARPAAPPAPASPPALPPSPGETFKQFSRIFDFLRAEGVLALISPARRGSQGGTLIVNGPPTPPGLASAPPPMVDLSPEHFNRLLRLTNHNVPVRLEVNLESTFHDRTGTQNVLGDIRGTGRPDEVVLVGAHLDSWHGATGATDNAIGVATVLEAVRILTASRVPLRRSVRVAFWQGEELFNLAGSRGYIQRYLFDERGTPTDSHRLLSAYLNLDYGSGRIRGIYLQGNDALKPVFDRWLADIGDGTLVASLRTALGSDQAAFEGAGIPGLSFIQDPLNYEQRTHHTNMDEPDYVVLDDARASAVALASVIYRLANADMLLPRKRVQ
ncbi:MAG TPA: M20/M25/M40 family metallo-hydrolase [Vicinamibacterales bacterium]|nr:M20/M25/M40 family metallo-hydrolase [Vicinamibacterales bacterium]